MEMAGTPVDRLSDETLLAGFRVGDHETALAFVRRSQSRVFGLAVTILRDAALAEDVAQRTFERAWRHASTYDARRASVRAWLTTIAHNLAIDTVRARVPDPIDPQDLLSHIDLTDNQPEQRALGRESATQLQVALRELPEEQARAVLLAAYQGLTAAEIADREGIPLGTAKTRIRSGMIKLRRTLDIAEMPEQA
jgi:RNA polymerase sigma factor (sigma-70 family)